jgi:hypothetical protein
MQDDVTTPDATALAQQSEADASATAIGQAEADADRETSEQEGEDSREQNQDQDQDEGDQNEPQRPRRKSGAERWRDRARRAEAELSELRSRQVVTDPSNTPAHVAQAFEAEIVSEIGPEPRERDFEDWPAYQRAVNAWDTRRILAEERVTARFAARENVAREVAATIQDEFDNNARALAENVTDYKDVVGSSDLRVNRVVESLIVESEKGPLIVYHLAKNPERVEALNRLSPVAAAREIGRLETRLSLPNANRATRATTPETPLRGGAAHTKDPRDMSMEEFVRWREAGGG